VNLIDILLLFIVAMAMLSGWKKGFIAGVIELVVWLGSLLIGYLSYPYAAALLEQYIPSLGIWTLPVAFIGMIILARIILWFIASHLLHSTPPEVHGHGFNRFLGIVPGFVNGVIYAVVIAALLMALPLFDGLSEKTRESKIADRLVVQAAWLDEKLSPVFDEAISKTMNRMTVDPKSEKSVELHFTVANAKIRQDLETRMLELVNEERKKQGLKALKPDPELTLVARKHSQDMFARGYFSHVTPEGKAPADRIRAAHVAFVTAGENLALAPTLNLAHTGLMNSPGHRANILHKAYGRLGIGILDGGRHGLMVTQNFRN
jgi:uncharacterized protein YkwD